MSLNKTFLISLTLGASCLVTMTSCSHDDGRDFPYDYLAVQKEPDGLWSFYSPDGDLECKDEFKNRPSDVVDGYFFAQEDNPGLLSLYKFSDVHHAVASGFDQLGYMGDGLIPATRDKERISLLNGKGEVKFTLEPVGGKEVTMCRPRFSQGMLAIAVNNAKGVPAWGYVNTKGEVAIPPRYTIAHDFNENLAIVCLSDSTRGEKAEWAVIDKNGDVVKKFATGTEPLKDRFLSGHLAVRDKDGHIAMINKKGETDIKLPESATSVTDWNDGYIIYGNIGDKYGVMNYDAEIIVRPKFEKMQIIGSDEFLGDLIKHDGTQQGVIFKGDSDNSKRTECYWDGVTWEGRFGLVGHTGGSDIFLNNNGKPRNIATFNRIGGVEPGTIFSNFNVNNDAIKYIADIINSNGVGKFTIGEVPEKLFTDTAKYVSKFNAELPELSKNGNGFSITTTAYFSSYISGFWYDDNYRPIYDWNQDCSLSRFSIDVTSDKWDNKKATMLAKAIAKKGYILDDSTNAGEKNYCALLTNSKLAVIIENNTITICRNSKENRDNAKKLINSYKTGGERPYFDFK